MTESIPETRVCRIVSYPGLVPYADALAEQYALVRHRQEGESEDTLMLLEHPPTITLGRGTDDADLLTDVQALKARGIAVERVDRGGEITYHAPGQLVGYPILDLRAHGQDLHRYLRSLEEVLIRALAAFGVVSRRIPGLTGVWVGDAKIAALGIKVSRWVSMHGFALNVSPDLTPMRQDIVPCGIRDRGVTSLAELLSVPPSRSEVEPQVIAAFTEVFHVRPQLTNYAGIMAP